MRRGVRDDVPSRNTADYVRFDPLFPLFGILRGLGASGDHHQGHAGQLRQRLQEVLRRLWPANLRPQPLHEESGSELVAGLRAGAGSGRKGLASRGRSHQGADKRQVERPSFGRIDVKLPPLPHSAKEQGSLIMKRCLCLSLIMKRCLCLSLFVALTLAGNAAFAADECTKITATGHPAYPEIAYKNGADI